MCWPKSSEHFSHGMRFHVLYVCTLGRCDVRRLRWPMLHEFACSFSRVASESLFDSVFELGPLLLSHVQHFSVLAEIVRAFQLRDESPRSLRCAFTRCDVRRLRWPMLHEFACSSSCVAPESLFDSVFELGPLSLSHVQHFNVLAEIVRAFQPHGNL
jgi:hypothetical protein